MEALPQGPVRGDTRFEPDRVQALLDDLASWNDGARRCVEPGLRAAVTRCRDASPQPLDLSEALECALEEQAKMRAALSLSLDTASPEALRTLRHDVLAPWRTLAALAELLDGHAAETPEAAQTALRSLLDERLMALELAWERHYQMLTALPPQWVEGGRVVASVVAEYEAELRALHLECVLGAGGNTWVAPTAFETIWRSLFEWALLYEDGQTARSWNVWPLEEPGQTWWSFQREGQAPGPGNQLASASGFKPPSSLEKKATLLLGRVQALVEVHGGLFTRIKKTGTGDLVEFGLPKPQVL